MVSLLPFLKALYVPKVQLNQIRISLEVVNTHPLAFILPLGPIADATAWSRALRHRPDTPGLPTPTVSTANVHLHHVGARITRLNGIDDVLREAGDGAAFEGEMCAVVLLLAE